MRYLSFLLLSATLLMYGCKDDSFGDLKVTKITKSYFDYKGGEGSVTVNNKGKTVKASVDQSWVSYSVKGSTVTYTVSEYTDGDEERQAKLKVTAGDNRTTILIRQEPIGEPYLNVRPLETLVINADGTNNFLRVYTNTGGFTVDIVEGNDWIKGYTVEDEYAYLNVDPNDSWEDLTGKVIVTCADVNIPQVSMNIVQSARGVRYDDLLGVWEMTASGIDIDPETNEYEEYKLDVTFSAQDGDASYMVNGLEYPFWIGFIEEFQWMTLFSGQRVDGVGNNYTHLYLYMRDTPDPTAPHQYYQGVDMNLIGDVYRIDDTFKFEFDRYSGTWTPTPTANWNAYAQGFDFRYRAVDAPGTSTHVEGARAYMYIKMTKK